MRVTNALVRAARMAPRQLAAVDETKRLQWEELANEVSRMAGSIRMRGVTHADRVAILAKNGIGYLTAWFAIPWAGAVIVPLNTRLAPAELEHQLVDANVSLLLYDESFAATAKKLHARAVVPQIASLVDTSSEDPAAEYNGSGELAGIFYTGGTTGVPKGVMLSHGNLTAMATNLLMHIDFKPGDVLFHAAPMFHLADIGTLFGTMATGTHVFRAELDPAKLIIDFAAHGVTHCFTVPVLIERLTREAARGDLNLSTLRYLGYGGSPMPAASLEKARSQFPRVKFIQGYGQTEFPAATVLSPEDHEPTADPNLLRSCGRACYGYDIRILDETGVEVPHGTVGEIVGRGDNTMMGYLGKPEETAEVLRDGWLYTRDAGWMDENGYVFVTDRLKDMIVTGAENVYSIEVENALSYHPAVHECTVIGVPDPEWGERVHAVVVLASAQPEPKVSELIAHCREYIAGFKIPKSWEFRRAPLPRSAAGKILKRDIRNSAAENDPE